MLSLTAFHETFHWLGKQGKLGERYQKTLINNIIGYLKGSEDHDYEAIRQQRLDLGYSEDKVDEEIAAQYFGTILAEREFQKYAAEQDAPLWKRIIDHVKAFIEDIRGRIEQRFGSDRAVQAALMSDVEFIERQVKAFDVMLDAVMEERAKGEIEQTKEGTDYSFAGEQSKTADRTMLQKAQ
ncbi:MAG: hypothetical protein IJR51_02600, partial [Clostridia bacterium]|nr:hypothetical protein [Clostridia bacterium]